MKLYVTPKTTLKLLLIYCTILFFSCQEYSTIQEERLKNSNNNVKPKSLTSTSKSSRINLKIIKSAKTKYKVKDVKESTKEIKKLANKYGGYISNLSYQNNLYRIENNFTIKIPRDYFDVFLDSIHNYIEFVDYENIITKDVTKDYFDASSRLKTKEEVKKRYEEILRKKAKTVDDILNTEEKLRIIQEEIDATKGKLNYFKNRISFSSIEIELYEEVDYKPAPKTYNKSFLSETKDGFKNGTAIISKILIGIVNIWPLLILGIGIFLIYKRRKK